MTDDEQGRILVPLANPDNCLSLAGLADCYAGGVPRGITLLSLVGGHNDEGAAREVIALGRTSLSQFHRVYESIRYDAKPAHGIIKEAKEEKADAIIMGWHRPDEKKEHRGRVLDPVLKKSPCPVVIAKDYFHDPRNLPRQILVPLSGIKANDELALKTAEKMLDPLKSGRITILYYNRSSIKLVLINYLMTQVVSSPRIKLDGIASMSDKPVKTTILQARDFDLVVLGIHEPWLIKKGKPSYSERVAQGLEGALLMVRAPQAVRSKISFFT